MRLSLYVFRKGSSLQQPLTHFSTASSKCEELVKITSRLLAYVSSNRQYVSFDLTKVLKWSLLYTSTRYSLRLEQQFCRMAMESTCLVQHAKKHCYCV
jgi:hypothetical protein